MGINKIDHALKIVEAVYVGVYYIILSAFAHF